jgi:hypothetical protein
MSKVLRSGLAAVVENRVLIYPSKIERLSDAMEIYPADAYVLVDDKPSILSAARERVRVPLTTVLVRQGRYAETRPVDATIVTDVTVDRIEQLLNFDFSNIAF